MKILEYFKTSISFLKIAYSSIIIIVTWISVSSSRNRFTDFRFLLWYMRYYWHLWSRTKKCLYSCTILRTWLTARGSGIGSVCLITDTDSPVRMDWSILRVVEKILERRISAGILSPTDTSTMSPGTISLARILWTPDLSPRTTLPISGSYSLSASIADSAFRSCQTPTTALAIRMSRMTKGSTKAVNASSCSSNKANTW